MEANDEIFGWNTLKIDEEKYFNDRTSRKRKLTDEEEHKIKSTSYKINKDPLSLDEKPNHMTKKASLQKGRFLFCSTLIYNLTNLYYTFGK